MSTLLDVRDLSVSFPTRDGEVAAVTSLTCSLERGETLAIVGESGSGKSVAALALLGLVPPPGQITAGEILFDGEDLRSLPARAMQAVRGKRIGMIFQDPTTSLNPVLTIGWQLAESLRWHEGLGKAAALQRAIEALTLVGIPDAARRSNDYPHQFSGGQRQRIMIAMAIACRPSLLIADEPTTALDVTIQAEIVALVESLQQELGMGVIWITHDLALVAGFADRVAVMYAGAIVECGSTTAVFEAAAHPYTQGLLHSMPDFRAPVANRLASIDGAPPDAGRLPAGCAFAPRCGAVRPRCTVERPVLADAAGGSAAACWLVADQ